MLAGEQRFRDVESLLDRLIERDRNQLLESGIQIRDESCRSYHYKMDQLIWAFTFEKREPRPPEILAVTVCATVAEPIEEEPIEFVLRIKSEVFQLSKESRRHRSREMSFPVEMVESRGIADLVIRNINDGFQWLHDTV